MKYAQRSLEEQLYLYGWLALAAGAVGICLYALFLYPLVQDVGCVFLRMTGFYCPGCGGTRAVIALVHGHFVQALWYHPLVMYGALIYGGFMLSHTLEKLHLFHVRGWQFHNWYLYGAVGILAVNWIVKNVLQFKFHIFMV